MIKDLSVKEQYIYKDVVFSNIEEAEYAMVELTLNTEGKIIEIAEKYSKKETEGWKLIGKPYTYIDLISTPVKKLEEVYEIMYKNHYSKLPLLEIRREKDGDQLY